MQPTGLKMKTGSSGDFFFPSKLLFFSVSKNTEANDLPSSEIRAAVSNLTAH